MTHDDAIQMFGLPAARADRDRIHRLLWQVIRREHPAENRVELLRVLCVQLFSLGMVEDSLLIWEAKQSDFDAGCGIDVQFLCGGGLEATKNFLTESRTMIANEALRYLTDCELAGDFRGFSPSLVVTQYRRYYHLDCWLEKPVREISNTRRL
jgi:hypothetical protein